MDPESNNRDKIYHEVAGIIYALAGSHRINHQERDFLLNLLEAVVMKKEDRGFIAVLKIWQKSPGDNEIDEIIKATAINIDLNNSHSLDQYTQIISELINEKREV